MFDSHLSKLDTTWVHIKFNLTENGYNNYAKYTYVREIHQNTRRNYGADKFFFDL